VDEIAEIAVSTMGSLRGMKWNILHINGPTTTRCRTRQPGAVPRRGSSATARDEAFLQRRLMAGDGARCRAGRRRGESGGDREVHS